MIVLSKAMKEREIPPGKNFYLSEYKNELMTASTEPSVFRTMKLKDYATLIGTACGFFALFAAVYFHAFRFAGFMIFLGILADLLDGFLARKMNQINEFGKQLDSLSDGFVFGVVPAVVVFVCYTQPVTQSGLSGHHWGIMFVSAFIFLCGAILRLAYFNVSTNEGYTGLPTPLSAAFITMALEIDYYAWGSMHTTTWFNYFMHYTIPILLIFLAWLNVTNKVAYGKTFRKKAGKLKYLIIGIGMSVLVLFAISLIPNFGAAWLIVLGLAILWVLGFIFIGLGFKSVRNPSD
jgi:CDP-diacylglycerol--serine O-phosphatidyltransferase